MIKAMDAGSSVVLPVGIVIPRRIDSGVRGWPGTEGAQIDLTAEWDEVDQEYRLVDLRVRSAEGVTGTLLRNLPVKAILRWLVHSKAQIDGQPAHLDSDALHLLASTGPTPTTLDAVAKIYTLAGVTLDPPAKRVRDEFGIPQRTATHWIKLARERGHLPEMATKNIDDVEFPELEFTDGADDGEH